MPADISSTTELQICLSPLKKDPISLMHSALCPTTTLHGRQVFECTGAMPAKEYEVLYCTLLELGTATASMGAIANQEQDDLIENTRVGEGQSIVEKVLAG